MTFFLITLDTRSWLQMQSPPDSLTERLLLISSLKPCSLSSRNTELVPPRFSSRLASLVSLKTCVMKGCQRSLLNSRHTAKVSSCERNTRRCATKGNIPENYQYLCHLFSGESTFYIMTASNNLQSLIEILEILFPQTTKR